MTSEKKRRLEKAGWKTGSVPEFLELSPDETAYVELKVHLARELKSRRKKLGISQVEAAKRLRSSQSRVAKMEAGDPSVSIDLLVRSLLTLGSRITMQPKGV
jgi:predicted XRE-type DNA-binding protein